MTQPLDLYYWPTPNGFKIAIALEEMALPYTCHLVDIGKGDQFTPEYVKLSPNSKMPVIVDPEGPDGAPISIMESGAILQYLARKTGQFYGTTERDRIEVDQWLFFQVGHVGPMGGQAHHFLKYAPAMDPPHDLPYAKDRFRAEVGRLYKVMNDRLADREFIAGDFFSIADMALWPWTRGYQRREQTMDDKPHLARWLDTIAARPAVEVGGKLHVDRSSNFDKDREAQKILFRTK